MTNSQLLRDFMDRVWTGGDVDAVDEYLGSTYIIYSDPVIPGTDRRSIATLSRSASSHCEVRSPICDLS
jgi:hypothetical protein